MSDGERTRRRRRRRATAPQGSPPTSPPPAATGSPPPAAAPTAPTAPAATPPASPSPSKPAAKRRPREGPTERGLRDLIGAGHSALGVDGALRGRDVNRPTEEDLAAAEQEVVVVRRHWKPRDGS